MQPMRLCHPPDGSTSPKYKLLCFITTKKICKEKNTLAFNRDRCCHLVLCLQLIPFHYCVIINYSLLVKNTFHNHATFCLIIFVNICPWSCTIKHYGLVMYRSCSKLLFLLLSFTFTCSHKHTSSLHNLYITSP
jgi:hypothetical protein